MASIDWFIGIRYIYARRGNHFSGFVSLMAIAATALGVTVLLTILSIMNGFEGELRGRILGLAAHLEIERGNRADWTALAADVAARPEVAAVAPYVARDVLVAGRGGVRAVEVRGIDTPRELAATALASHLRAGSIAAFDAAPYRVLIGRELADAFALAPGDSLTLITPQPTMTPAGMVPRVKRFVVAGVFEFGLQEHDGGLVLTHLDDAQRLFRAGDTIDGLRVRLHDAGGAVALKATLRAQLAGVGAIRDWTDTHQNLFRALAIEKTVMFVILALAIAIAAFNVVSILVVAVSDKRADIAMLSALGLERGGVMRIFLVQGGVTGVIGVVAGLAGGALLAANIDSLVGLVEHTFGFHVFSPDVYYISRIPSELRRGDFVAAAILASILSFAAPLYPAWLAASTNISAGLRHE